MERNEIKMKLSILLTLALVGCGTDSKSDPVATEPATVVETPETVTPTETPPDYFATVQAAARGLTKGKTLNTIDATALANLSLDENAAEGTKAYFKGLNRVTFWICKGTSTIQAYTIKSEEKVLLYTQCADLLGERAPALAIRDVLATKLTTEELAYFTAIKTVNTDHINGDPARFYNVITSRPGTGTARIYYSIDVCENGKVFTIYDESTTPATQTRDTTICN